MTANCKMPCMVFVLITSAFLACPAKGLLSWPFDLNRLTEESDLVCKVRIVSVVMKGKYDVRGFYTPLEADKKTEFGCTRCGYESHAIQWLCPSCRNWASMKPL